MSDLGDRMKSYERACKTVLTPRTPVIIRVDGKAFHTYARGCVRPFDGHLIAAMDAVALALCAEVDGAKLAYVQSDEISILVHTYRTFEQQPWFANEVQKLVSITAGVASGVMTEVSPVVFGTVRRACFDSRAFTMPESDVNNYFLWRQKDWTRNSVQMLARSLYSHRECTGKSNPELQEMCFQKGHNWNDLPTHLKRGRAVVKVPRLVAGKDGEDVLRGKWEVDNEIPIFSQDRDYVERLLATEDALNGRAGSGSEVAGDSETTKATETETP